MGKWPGAELQIHRLNRNIFQYQIYLAFEFVISNQAILRKITVYIGLRLVGKILVIISEIYQIFFYIKID